MASRRRLRGKLIGGAVLVAVIAAATNQGEEPSAASDGDIPDNYKALYQAASSTCPNLDWPLLAAIGKVETDHGRSPLDGVHSGTNEAGAMGPMQVIRPTWNAIREQHPEIGPNVYDPHNAIPAAAHLLCDEGVRRGDIEGAVFAYNHADWYVRKVLNQAEAYR